MDVPAKLAARVRLFDTGHNRKTDARDAHSIAIVAVRTTTLRVLRPDGELEALRMLCDRREELTRLAGPDREPAPAAARRAGPGQAKKDLTALQAKAILATVRPRDIAGKTRRRIAAEELADLVAVEAKMKKSTAELKVLVKARGSRLMDLRGVGPVVAARTLADVGDVARFADRNRFASWTGTAPLDASSGEQNRHRLSRAGNRRMNHMIHIAAISQIRLDTPGRAYYRRKLAARQDQARSAALPQAQDLRRPLPPTPRRRPSPSARCGPGRALRGVSRIQRGRPAPAHRHFGSATSRTRDTDATPHPRPGRGNQTTRLTQRGAERTRVCERVDHAHHKQIRAFSLVEETVKPLR